MTNTEFRRRLAAAMAAGSALQGAACAKAPADAGPVAADSASGSAIAKADASVSAIAPSASSATAGDDSLPKDPPAPKEDAALCGGKATTVECFDRERMARIKEGGGSYTDRLPSPPLPDAKIDGNGCLELKYVKNGCCNPAVSGPRVTDKRCCYTFCEGACCGRPFVVDAETRTAGILTRGDWIEDAGIFGMADDFIQLDARLRDRLADAWTHDAAMEHASIASFARFTLQLLAVGAPPEFVADAQRATADEISHAKMAFALATRFRGTPVGPSSLDVSGVVLATSVENVVHAAVVEGCIGETIAALAAERALSFVKDPDTRRVLEIVARDEARHAELAWRFVAWVFARGGDSVTLAARDAFDAEARRIARGSMPVADGDVDPDAWHAMGRLGREELDDVARRAIVDVIGPCVSALLASPDEERFSPLDVA
ncbi:MAG: ferritin-like domain-containing protein [Polyangiaceae bacterium]